MSRKWTAQNKEDVLYAYVRQVHALGKNMRLAGIDLLLYRADCLNKAQPIVFDETMHRHFTPSLAKKFLVVNYDTLTKCRDEFLEKRLEEGQALESVPVQNAFTQPTPKIDFPETKISPSNEGDDLLPEDKRHPMLKKLNDTISLIEEMKSIANQLIATSQLNVQAIDKALHRDLPSSSLNVVKPTPIKLRSMGQARVVFSQKPKAIVCGFSRSLTDQLHDAMPRYELHVRRTDAALLQCVTEHPDATVIILSDKYKFGERLKYVTDAFGITVMRTLDKREYLMEAVNEINKYQF